MGNFPSDTLFKSFSSKYITINRLSEYTWCGGEDLEWWRLVSQQQKVNSKRRLQIIQNVQEGKRHKKKRDIKFLSFQICVVTNLSAPSCFCLCSFCFQWQRRYFYTFKDPWNRFQGINSASLCRLAGQSRKVKSRYGARNRFQEPSVELSSQATLAVVPVRQVDNMPTWFLAFIAGQPNSYSVPSRYM